MRVYTEIQRLPKWLFIVIAPSFLIVITLMVYAYSNATSVAEKEELLFVLLAIILVETIAVVFVSSIRQVVRIDETGISYTYPPFKRKEVHIPITKIKHYDLVTYPYMHYGYHVGFWNVLRKEPSISTIGVRKAIRLTFKNDKTLLIGTRKPEAFLKTLHHSIQREH